MPWINSFEHAGPHLWPVRSAIVSAILRVRNTPYAVVKGALTILAQADSRLPNARTGMLGHLVSTSRQSPPDFGFAAWLRATRGAFQSKSQRIVALLSEAMHHPRKQPAHPQ
jgi:hypothetical protein